MVDLPPLTDNENTKIFSINYKITGFGGQQKIISISENQFKYFEDKSEDFIRENVLGINNGVPKNLSLEEWNSISSEHDFSGFTFGSSELEINYNNKLIIISLNKKHLKEVGVSYKKIKLNLKDLKKKTKQKYFFLGELKEEGLIESEFKIEEPLEIKKFKINTIEFNNWEIISEIYYDSFILDTVSEENEVIGEEFNILNI